MEAYSILILSSINLMRLARLMKAMKLVSGINFFVSHPPIALLNGRTPPVRPLSHSLLCNEFKGAVGSIGPYHPIRMWSRATKSTLSLQARASSI